MAIVSDDEPIEHATSSTAREAGREAAESYHGTFGVDIPDNDEGKAKWLANEALDTAREMAERSADADRLARGDEWDTGDLVGIPPRPVEPWQVRDYEVREALGEVSGEIQRAVDGLPGVDIDAPAAKPYARPTEADVGLSAANPDAPPASVVEDTPIVDVGLVAAEEQPLVSIDEDTTPSVLADPVPETAPVAESESTWWE